MNSDKRQRQLAEEENDREIKDLKVASGLLSTMQAERLDWMYEATSSLKGKDQLEDDLMNSAVPDQCDADIENMKKLSEGGVAGAIFLNTATSATRDMMSKLREDPMFQIRQQELLQRESILNNPLMKAKLERRNARKEDKKAKKEAKKAKKKEKKKKKKKKGDSSSSSDEAPAAPTANRSQQRERHRSRSRSRRHDNRSGWERQRDEYREKQRKEREEAYERKQEGRGHATTGLSREEKERRLREMQNQGKDHERYKDTREHEYTRKEKELERKEKELREKGDRSVFKKMNQSTYMESEKTMADRLQSNRHRRQKGIIDNLEKD